MLVREGLSLGGILLSARALSVGKGRLSVVCLLLWEGLSLGGILLSVIQRSSAAIAYTVGIIDICTAF